MVHPALGPCWIWLGHQRQGGYGYREWRGAKVLAHRWSYELLVGPVPEGLELDHLCNTPACVNPRHLEPVTPTENMRRKVIRKTSCSHGHTYSPENTYVRRDGTRDCRKCISRRASQYKKRKRAERFTPA